MAEGGVSGATLVRKLQGVPEGELRLDVAMDVVLVALRIVSIRYSTRVEATCTDDVEILSIAHLHHHKDQHDSPE